MKNLIPLLLLILGASLLGCRNSDGSQSDAAPTNIYIAPNTPTAAQLPELDKGWTKIEPGGETRCAHDTPYAFWVRPGNVNKLMVYFQGGGGCWNAETCQQGSDFYDPSVTERDNPTLTRRASLTWRTRITHSVIITWFLPLPARLIFTWAQSKAPTSQPTVNPLPFITKVR